MLVSHNINVTLIPLQVVGMSWIECPGGAYNLKASTSKVSKAQLEFDIQCVLVLRIYAITNTFQPQGYYSPPCGRRVAEDGAIAYTVFRY